MKIHVELDLSTAKTIQLDSINDDGSACVYVEFESGNAEYKVSAAQLQDMVATASFTWNAKAYKNTLKAVL